MAVAQTQYRFGRNEGNEATHGWYASQNTKIALAPAVTFLLRVNVQDSGTGTGPPLIIQLYYSKNGGAKAIITNVTSTVKGVTSVLTEDADCTQRLTGGTGTFLSNNDGQSEELVTAGSGTFSLAANGCVEVEFSLQLVSGVAHGDTVDFFVYINGAQVTATVTPRVVVTLAEDTWGGLESRCSGRADNPWFMPSR